MATEIRIDGNLVEMHNHLIPQVTINVDEDQLRTIGDQVLRINVRGLVSKAGREARFYVVLAGNGDKCKATLISQAGTSDFTVTRQGHFVDWESLNNK